MNAVGKVGHHLHVVLDPNHGDTELVLYAQDETRKILPLVAIEAGGRFVEHQQFRLKRERARKTDHLLDAERQAGHRRMTVAFDLDEFDDPLHGLAVADLLLPHARQKKHLGERRGADARVPAGEQVVEHGHVAEQFAVLERARQAHSRDLVRRPPADVFAAKADRSLAAVDAADAVERAGLAGAVGADQREQLAGPHAERHIVEHREPAEAQRQACNLQLSHTISGCGDIV